MTARQARLALPALVALLASAASAGEIASTRGAATSTTATTTAAATITTGAAVGDRPASPLPRAAAVAAAPLDAAPLAAAPAVAVPAAAAVVPTATLRLAHEPPRDAVAGKPVPLVVNVEGVTGQSPRLLVRFRPEGSRSFLTQELAPAGRGRFVGELPASASRGLGVAYWIVLTTGDGVETLALGSEAAPLRLSLSPPPDVAEGRLPLAVAGTGAAVAASGGLVLAIRRRRRLRREERAFWVGVLFPLVHLDETTLAARLERLAGRELGHPHEGPRAYTVEELRARLDEVRRTDFKSLYRSLRQNGGMAA